MKLKVDTFPICEKNGAGVIRTNRRSAEMMAIPVIDAPSGSTVMSGWKPTAPRRRLKPRARVNCTTGQRGDVVVEVTAGPGRCCYHRPFVQVLDPALRDAHPADEQVGRQQLPAVVVLL